MREYKSECEHSVPPGSAIVTFPLYPKPHNIMDALEKGDTTSAWVKDLWLD